jgi:sugar phosphate isomerase/epimerase
MQLSVATANLYLQPFEQTLEIIAEAGFQNIELDLFWERKEWAMAQHLRNVPIKQAVRLIEQSGLRITSIHDGGGVLETGNSPVGFINPALDEYLDYMGYAPDCLVFHTPHIESDKDTQWWERISDKIVSSLEIYRKACSFVTIENMPFFAGYDVPLTTPEELNAFAVQNGLSVTLDTTHYAQIGTDIVEAARKLEKNIKTVHLSDFAAGRAHVFIGEGELNLSGLFDVIDKKDINAVTLECSLSSIDYPGQEMSYNEMVSRMREARIRLEHLL